MKDFIHNTIQYKLNSRKRGLRKINLIEIKEKVNEK
jgi:hypothetical protein